ncbi:hypothetical protein PEC302110_22580 [Pectobacterium araliae]|uniref:Uncharacterized protein n=1 Tax=Pectobacterium araliae TaxID=3073862 RepID=A0AAN0KAV6_9GAMM|nr:hypothetical protein PEC302110_22580 [Pectobacterium sp. MAFF 302110]
MSDADREIKNRAPLPSALIIYSVLNKNDSNKPARGKVMSKQDEQRLLVRIATLYYSEGMKQCVSALV